MNMLSSNSRTRVAAANFAIVLLILYLAPAAICYDDSHLPLSQAEVARRFPQKQLPCPDLDTASQVQIGTQAIHLEVEDHETAPDALYADTRLVISGKDNNGHPWKVTTGWSRLGCELFSSDLDGNGRQDLIWVSYSGALGDQPPSNLLILLFDRDGRPVPSEFDGYFEADVHGVKEFLDLNRNGHAELVRQSINDGYYIASLYEARDAHWFLVRGRFGSRTYPLYTRYTSRVNHSATIPKPGRNPQYEDLSNSAILKQPPVRIEKLQWVKDKDDQRTYPTIELSDGRSCTMPAALVVDGEAGRQISMLGYTEETKQLLETIMSDKLPVRVNDPDLQEYLHRPPEKGNSSCDPKLIWAGAAPSGK